MLPGYLHFDLRRGLTADMLSASMASLLSDHTCIRDAFIALRLFDISFVINDNVFNSLRGTTVHFYRGDTLIEPISSRKPRARTASSDAAYLPKWDDNGATLGSSKPDFSQFIVGNLDLSEEVSLSKIEIFFKDSHLKPSIAAIAIKILETMRSPLFVEHALEPNSALWLICHLVMLSATLDALDPKFISASKICMSERKIATSKPSKLNNETWMRSLTSMLPVIEIEDAIDVDVVALAFIKALAGHFGARGESSILRMGIGFSAHNNPGARYLEALWCEADLPTSMTERGPKNNARMGLVHEISGRVRVTHDVSKLASLLSLHGAKTLSWQLVHSEKDLSHFHVQFLCHSDDKRDAIEAFLVKGNAENVVVKLVERHALARRLVSAPIGKGNKTDSVRFYEYIYHDRIVRVEPLQEDLDLYVQKTDYSDDVARGDLLLAWKKWRGRVASENT